MTGELGRLRELIATLRPHDASIAVAVLELVRLADEAGVVDRGDWIVAVRTAYDRTTTNDATAAMTPAWEAGDSTDAARELASYLGDHVLGRLEERDVARRDPADDGWERICISSGLLDALRMDREGIIGELESEIAELLARSEQIAPRRGEARKETAVDGGSTLSSRGLTKSYRRRKVVNSVDLRVSQGEIVGLLGPNGAGKTTTFYMIVGLIGPDAGDVYLDDDRLTKVPMYRRARRGIGYLSQEPSVFRRLSVEQNVMAILETLPLKKRDRRERLESLLDELSIKHLRKAKAYSLSGGERRRLEITRALVSDPKFMLLDEPFAGVDPIAVHDIQQIVASLRHRGIGVIITDHNVEQTLDIVDRAYIMYDGRVRVSGTVAELVWSEEVAEIYFGPTLTARMRERYQPPVAV